MPTDKTKPSGQKRGGHKPLAVGVAPKIIAEVDKARAKMPFPMSRGAMAGLLIERGLVNFDAQKYGAD